eukprot:756075-Hanusia_phi.AAC.1
MSSLEVHTSARKSPPSPSSSLLVLILLILLPRPRPRPRPSAPPPSPSPLDPGFCNRGSGLLAPGQAHIGDVQKPLAVDPLQAQNDGRTLVLVRETEEEGRRGTGGEEERWYGEEGGGKKWSVEEGMPSGTGRGGEEEGGGRRGMEGQGG